MRGVIVGIILAAPAMAAAQPEAGADAYPVEHTERPLLLPAAGIEGTAMLQVLDLDYDDDGYEMVSLRPGARYGLASAEVEGGLTIGLNEPEGVYAETLRSIDLAARLGIGADATAGVELSAGNPSSDFASYLVAATVATRQRYGAASLDLGAAAGYTFASSDSAYDTIHLRGRIAATAQLTPVFALQGRGELYWVDITGESDPSFPLPGWYLGQQYGVAALMAATATLDVIAGFDMLSTADSNVKLFTLGVAARRLP